jgi:uncharacterized OB-fold protein
MRVLPEVTPQNAHFWQGGARGELCFLRCKDCRTWVHPPAPVCSSCYSRALAPETASGRGRVLTYTVNHQAWMPGDKVPYTLVVVELDEQPGLRILSELVSGDARAGMRVRVRFEQVEDVYIPLFEADA